LSGSVHLFYLFLLVWTFEQCQSFVGERQKSMGHFCPAGTYLPLGPLTAGIHCASSMNRTNYRGGKFEVSISHLGGNVRLGFLSFCEGGKDF
jgi:hypothetical protein